MSLLLDALKRAEKAKEAAQRGDKKSEAPVESALSLEPTPEEAKRVMTRDKLPDISTPLEIASDDISPQQAAASAAPAPASVPELTPPPRPQASAGAVRPAARPAQGNQAAQRAAAQSVFQAKFKEPNPRLPFFITVGVLGVFAISTIVYFWLQLRPAPPLVNAIPKPPAGEAAVETARAPTTAPGSSRSATPQGQAIPGLPAGPSAPASSAAQPAQVAGATPASAIAAASLPAQASKPATAEARPASRVQAVAPVPPARPQTAQTQTTEPAPAAASPVTTRSFGRRSVARVNPGVAAGYAAYQAGDVAGARRSYQQALRAEPRNVDALLGMAAVELRAGQYALADRYYRQVLRLDPRNPHAQAGMLALRNQQVDPVAAESRVKSLIAQDPGAEGLQFTLGNQYAQQGRWGEAQQAYFRALAADPKNPDFAYNLAVSLDHLRQVKPAVQHYRLALQLAESRSAGFDAQAVRARVAQLEH